MTQQQSPDFPYYRSPSTIRNEVFSHRMRGLDEHEVREYLDLLADQVAATELEREQLQTENRRLREEAERLRTSSGAGAGSDASDDISPQAVILFSQAQQVADQLVEEAVLHARDLMSSARHQQREILEQAHKAAEAAARQAAAANGREMVSSAAGAADSSASVPEIEYVRTFAQVAQVQLRSVLEALSEQVDRLGEVTREAAPPEGRRRALEEGSARAYAERTWRVEPRPPRPSDDV